MAISPDQIKTARGLLGWSQKALAKRARLTAETTRSIETGSRRRRDHALEREAPREKAHRVGDQRVASRRAGSPSCAPSTARLQSPECNAAFLGRLFVGPLLGRLFAQGRSSCDINRRHPGFNCGYFEKGYC
jgi:DNA-binding XRE family transcriptional regulator